MIEIETRTFTREELYNLVWAKPITSIADELGVSDRGLAKICERNRIPTPSRGYWAKVVAGKVMGKAPLPDISNMGEKGNIEVRATPKPSAEVVEATKKLRVEEASLVPLQIPESLRGLHRIVAAWVDAHKKDQEKTRHERSRAKGSWYQPQIRADLTEHDRYRLQVTSTFLIALERAGGIVDSGKIRGEISLTICGEKVECTIVQKMLRGLSTKGREEKNWTAWPEDHNHGLQPSGFLRFTLNTYGIGPRDMVESNSAKAETLLPIFVSRIMAAGPILVQKRKDEQERRRIWDLQQAERAERQRQAELDEKRWKQFKGLAHNWEECRRLRDFIVALKQSDPVSKLPVEGKTFDEWLIWAEERLAHLDPLAPGADGPFALPVPSYAFG